MEKKPEALKNPDLCRKPEPVKKPEEIKIAFHLNTLTHGGAERVVTNLANRFAAEGYQVFVATEWTDEDYARGMRRKTGPPAICAESAIWKNLWRSTGRTWSWLLQGSHFLGH